MARRSLVMPAVPDIRNFVIQKRSQNRKKQYCPNKRTDSIQQCIRTNTPKEEEEEEKKHKK